MFCLGFEVGITALVNAIIESVVLGFGVYLYCSSILGVAALFLLNDQVPFAPSEILHACLLEQELALD